jgi:hypothetical protein
VFHDVASAPAVERALLKTSLKSNLARRQLRHVDESFAPFSQCLMALFDYYLIENANTLNSQVGVFLGNKMHKIFCLHIGVFFQFVSDFSSYQDKASVFTSQNINYPYFFRILWRQKTGWAIDTSLKTNEQEVQALRDKYLPPKDRKTEKHQRSEKQEDKERQQELVILEQI